MRDSCAPVLACQGHPWPEALDCDRFPAEEDMCLTPHAKFNHFAKGASGGFFDRRRRNEAPPPPDSSR